MRDGDSRGGTRIANPNRQCAVLVDAMVLSLVSHHEIRRGHFAAMKEDEPSILLANHTSVRSWGIGDRHVEDVVIF